ncbi:MAG: FtsK/SpoIIIE domain-containing protein [Phycisphaerae bacterium]|nr:FtsK/SpoIIIE domain-containing protein [Phycisphaerae bacterium]
MPSTDAIARLESVLLSLRNAVSARAAEEKSCAETLKAERAANERTHDQTSSTARQRRTDERRAEDERFASRSAAIAAAYESDRREIDRSDRCTREAIETKTSTNLAAAKTRMDEAVWVAETVYEGAEDQPRITFEKAREEFTVRRQDLDELEEQGRVLARRYRQRLPEVPPPDATRLNSATSRAESGLVMSLGTAQEQLRAFKSLRIAGLFRGPILIVPFVLAMGAGGAAAFLMHGDDSRSLMIGAASGFAVMLVLAGALWTVAHREVRRAWLPLAETITIGRACSERAIADAATARVAREQELLAIRDFDVADATGKFGPLADEFGRKRQERLLRLSEKTPALLRDLETRRVEETADNTSTHAARVAEIEQIAATSLEAEEQRFTRERDVIEARATTCWNAMRAAWEDATQSELRALTETAAKDAEMFPLWSDPSWTEWSGAIDAPDAIRIGSLRFDLALCDGGLSKDPRLAVTVPTALNVPALLAFPHRSSLLVACDADSRAGGIEIVQSVLLRLLARVPPSKVRLVLIDPIGLGQSFAGFMHLADEMEALIGDRIWTEPRHIEQKLTDLTEHMETVIQKYLRNEFESIEAYNEQAGEIAEPLRYLVITDFPANITDIAAKRLQSILSSGPRCGVHTIIVRSGKSELPAGITDDDLRRGAVVIRKENDRFVVDGPELSRLRFTPDPAPHNELLIPLVRRIGKAAKEAGKVEVPFSMIAPKGDLKHGDGSGTEWWSESSAKRVRVPLGRSGATKLQYLTLGEGTSQHALIAGKTGSGKSTLLHALITNLACWYSPDEVEFYLIDFKKGVEFRTYAHHKLPHARAVAIESDREFGLSVLQGLDTELKRRGDLFRDLGVQDLNGYRKTGQAAPMPRTLLIIDEFQELFVEDDKVGQDSALLLDRLVRQGRAFGIHVILGSQTLGGAYSIARATMGQMGVRIALQCSEADSQLILSDDNSAARLLSRPGEAIYNDASGLLEGNSPFQVVWLPEEVRERYLDTAARLARERQTQARSLSHGTIVFEGNIPADPLTNRTVLERLEANDWMSGQRPTQLWLGDAIAIKPPTAATLRRQAAANVMVVGQHDLPATALMAMTMISVAAQRSPSDARFVLLDGTPADDPKHGLLAKVAAALPHTTHIVPWRDTDDAIRAVAEEAGARQAGGDDHTSVFLIVHGLQRYRQLRRNEDDYSFGGDTATASTDKLFAGILREGAPLGIHVILWCDTVVSLQRALDRSAMREFDWRAMFQLSATDSSTLIDSPAASRLGPQRALLYSEELGTIEKFRPWLLPTDEFLERARESLATKSAPVL